MCRDGTTDADVGIGTDAGSCTRPATPLDRAHHDAEWGVPLRDEVRLFERRTLEGAQAGLSWSTILRKREGYRRAFAGFEPAQNKAEIVEPDGRIMPAMQDSQQDATPAHRLIRSGHPHAAGRWRRTPYRSHAPRCPKAPPA
jgi:hypothetical protein